MQTVRFTLKLENSHAALLDRNSETQSELMETSLLANCDDDG